MKIKIKGDALKKYVRDNTDYLTSDYSGEDYWEKVMKRIAGKVLEVDTEFLFKYEFNTKPIPGISEDGIRIPEHYVEEIIDDVRRGKARCDLCGEVSNSTEVCTNCGRKDYLEPFFDEYDE